MRLPSILLLGLGISLGVSEPSRVGKWHSYTHKDQVNAFVEHRGYVYAGTKGGIRRIEPATMQEKEYDNLDGLLDCWITGFVVMQDGNLWAVSRAGFLYRKNGERWETHGRSYASLHWTWMDQSVLGMGKFIFLGSEKGLSVFDATRFVAQANVTHFGNALDVPVLSMIRRADTLVLGTPDGAYKIGLDTIDPVNPGPAHSSLMDPGSWSRIVFPEDSLLAGNVPPRQFGELEFFGDTLKSFSPGTVISSPLYVEALSGMAPRIGSTSYAIEWAGIRTAISTGSHVFLGGSYGMFYTPNPFDIAPTLYYQRSKSRFPADTIGGISAFGDEIWAQSFQGVQRFNPDSGGFVFKNTGVYPSPELISRGLKNVVMDTRGDAYLGSWGGGVFGFRDGAIRIWNDFSDPCIVPVGPGFPVVHAVSNISKSHLFFSIFKAERLAVHQLVHIDVSNDRLTCMDSNAAGGHPHALHVFGDTLVGVGSDLGVAFFNMKEGAFAPILTSVGLWKLDGVANETWDVAADRWGRPWAVIGERLAFADSVGDTAHASGGKFQIAAEFPGVECRNLEADPRKGLWVGCSNGLFRVEPGLTTLSKVTQYGLDDGLLSLSIRDISVDPANGKVWVATDRGVSMFESEAQPLLPNLGSLRVFPNPFQGRHQYMIFDNLPANSTLRIHNASGDVVRIFPPRDLRGNQAQWDGRNQDGRAVSPGVYLFSVISGSSVKRGKIIVAR